MPENMLTGKTALVTGSAKRTGKAIAIALANAGAETVIHYHHSKAEADDVVHQLQASGKKAYALQADLRNYSEIEEMITNVVEKSSKLDILINNVGNYLVKPIEQITPEEWDHLLQTTVTTTFYCCRAALPFMVKQSYGRIVNMGDSGADLLQAWSNITPYMIGKTGVLLLTKSLAANYGKHNITVNCVSPGILDNSTWKPEKNRIPTGRFGSYEDITNAVLFFLKENASYVTGANLKVSGGWNA